MAIKKDEQEILRTVTSVSGGKSSAYMALHYPTDHYVFAAVLTKDKNAIPKDEGLLRECQNKLPQFEASRELDQTLLNLFSLEQELGQAVEWTAAQITYDDLIDTGMLPNRLTRTCTHQLKLEPIFWHCYLNYYDGELPLLMNIGFRSDEGKRVERMGDCKHSKYKFSPHCDLSGQFAGKHRWIELDWRINSFPMWENDISKSEVVNFWLEKGWVFPQISNCDGCFFHRPQELWYQYQTYPERMQWWADQEEKLGVTFNKEQSYERIFSDQPLFDVRVDKDEACNCTD